MNCWKSQDKMHCTTKYIKLWVKLIDPFKVKYQRERQALFKLTSITLL